jgi:hypothetical protein
VSTALPCLPAAAMILDACRSRACGTRQRR